MSTKPKQPEASPALVVTAQRGTSAALGFSRAEYTPGDIVAHPTEGELKLLANASEPLAKWWGGPFAEPPRRSDGSRYPALAVRPRDKSVWLLQGPQRLIPLLSASRSEACRAVELCDDKALLAKVPQATSVHHVREAARHRLASGVQAEQFKHKPALLTLELEHRLPVVRLSDGSSRPATGYYASDLAALLAACTDEPTLQALAGQERYALLARAAGNRLVQLKTPAKPEPAKGDKAQPAAEATGEGEGAGATEPTGTEPGEGV